MDDAAPEYNVGEEVLFAGERYVIAGFSSGPAYRYRLLATGADGVRVAWAQPQHLARLSSYTEPRDDTGAA
jgi:hypothetical protein